MSHPSYHYNKQYITYIGQSLQVEVTNYICMKNSLDTEYYKLISAYAHEFYGWIILYNIIHDCDPHLVNYNGGLQTNISTLDFKNG